MADVGNSTTVTYGQTLSTFVQLFCRYIYICIYMADPHLHGWPANSPANDGPIGHSLLIMWQLGLFTPCQSCMFKLQLSTLHIQLTQQRASIQTPNLKGSCFLQTVAHSTVLWSSCGVQIQISYNNRLHNKGLQ
jgi:hypothetical protein